MVSLAFNVKFIYWVAPKNVPQHVAALWDLFSLDENKKQLADWTLSVPQVHHAANEAGSDQVHLVTFAVTFTHKTATYDNVKQARTIFMRACSICNDIVWKLPSLREPASGLLRFDRLLRCVYFLQDNPTTTSGFWGEWGLASVYSRCTSGDDGSPLAMLDKFLNEYQYHMPETSNNLEAGPSKNGLGNLKALTTDAGKNYKLVKKDASRLIRTQTAVDVEGLNSTVRDAIKRHCDVLDCMEATDAVNGGLATRLGELAEMIASFKALTKDMPTRPTPWWKIFGRGRVDKASRSMTKLQGRASALETEAKNLSDLSIHLDTAVKQHEGSCRRLVLKSHLQVQWRQLVDILDQPGADESLLSWLYGANIRAMERDYNRVYHLEQAVRRFKKGERAVCLEERSFVKLASQLDREVRKLSRDYAETVKKFAQGEMREHGSNMATKGKDKDMPWDSQSDYSDETLCEKKQ